MKPIKRQVIRNGVVKWEVDFGIVLGHRKRPLVNTEADADELVKNYKKELKASGEFWARMSESERLTTTATIVQIRDAGQTLSSVWADWQRWKKNNQQTVTTPMAYEEAVGEWKRRKLNAGKTERYVNNAVADLLKFGAGRERQNIHEIAPADLEEWIDQHKTWGLSSRRTNMSLFSSLWEVAIAKGWCSLNIVDRLEPIGKIGRIVKIYPNDTALNLMAAAVSNELTQQVIAPLALGLFGCMRPEEVESAKAIRAGKQPFGWSDIDLEHGQVTVSVHVAKTGDQRTIRLQPTAIEWLKFAKKLGNPLPPENERRLIDQCCELIGLDEWIRDGLRKNCATHLRVIYRNDYDVIKDCGNSIRILLKHYADLHTPEAVSFDYWKITPIKVLEYLKTEKWKNVVEAAAKAAYEKSKAATNISA